MRFVATKTGFALVIATAAGLMAMQPARAAGAYCPDAARAKPAKVPPDLVPAVAKAFQIDNDTAGKATSVRCVGSTLMACYVGANLDCDKADTRRTLAGATTWCRANPGAKVVPMSATGHDTIYQWSCNGSRAVAGKGEMTIDRQGYIANNWKQIQ